MEDEEGYGFLLSKQIDFSCQLMPNLSEDSTIRLVYLFGVNSTDENSSNPKGNVYKQIGSLGDRGEKTLVDTSTEMNFTKSRNHFLQFQTIFDHDELAGMSVLFQLFNTKQANQNLFNDWTFNDE